MYPAMNGFLTPLHVQHLDDGKSWRVLEPFEYHLGRADGEDYVRVPVGFITDFASIPRPLWSAWPPTGAYGKAAVIHDALYQMPFVQQLGGGLREVERRETDRIFLEGMIVIGVGWFTRRALYTGVRLGGWRPWNRYYALRKAD